MVDGLGEALSEAGELMQVGTRASSSTA